MKIDLAADLDIQAFSGASITDYNAGATNCILTKRSGSVKATQRPSIDVTEDAGAIAALNDRGRGIYYWEENSKLYIVHDNDVYATSQDTVAVDQITTGSERVTILESTVAPAYMIILDAENDEGWYMSAAESVVQIATAGAGTDDHFPTVLCHGGAVLDSYLFVMDEDGVIYNSKVGEPEKFEALSFIEAERSSDKGVYLGKHHDHIVAFGTQSIEFLYDAGNATGSPLNRRTDISYNIGCAGGLSVWENGDITYFLGSEVPGQIQVYKLENFKVTPVSNDGINSYITQGLTQSSLKINCSGFAAMGHETLLMTVYTLSSDSIVPSITLSYDSVTTKWGIWRTDTTSSSTFPLMAWTRRTGGQNPTVSARTGEGIMYDGDIIAVNDNLVPQDTILGKSSVYVVGVYETGTYEGSGASSSVDISLTIRTGLQDGGTRAWKFQGSETIIMENTTSSHDLTIKHSDEVSNSFDSGITVDTSDERKDYYQGGRFMRRNWQLEFSADEQIFLEAIDVDVGVGL